MESRTRNLLARMREKMQSHAGLKAYREKNGDTSAARFWHLLQADLMRLSPKEVAAYLVRHDLKLAEAGSFGSDLAKEFFASQSEDELRIRQEALLYACIEMDAAWKMGNLSSRPLNEQKKPLADKLELWRVP